MRFRKMMVLVLVLALAGQTAPDLSERFFNNSGSVIVFLGDSITHAGGYINDLKALIVKRYPQSKAKFVNQGKASETVSGLTENGHPGPRPVVFDRLDTVLAAEKPDLVIACYGMNDGIYHPYQTARAKAFQDGIQRLIRDVRATGAEIILATPPVFDSLQAANSDRLATGNDTAYKWTNAYRNYDSVLTAYSAWELSLRSAEQMVVDIHGPMLSWVKAQRKLDPKFTWTGDGIHPGAEGHQVMADALYAGMFSPVTGARILRSRPREQASPRRYFLNGRRCPLPEGAVNPDLPFPLLP